jgi:4-hydroxy-tetrahydrodipicolinate synthase
LKPWDHAKDVQEAGADAVLVMPPHNWLRFGNSLKTTYNFIKGIASAISIDIIVHLYPHATKAFYPVETLLELATIPNVAAIKMGTRQMSIYERDVKILREKAPHLSLLTCHDEYLLASLLPKMDGALIGFAALAPELMTALLEAVNREDLHAARIINDEITALKAAVYGIGDTSGEAHACMKEALVRRGFFSSGLMRLPVLPISAEENAASPKL